MQFPSGNVLLCFGDEPGLLYQLGGEGHRSCFTPDPVSKIFLRGAEITHPSFSSTLDALFQADCWASGAVQLLFAFRCPQPFPSKKLKSIFESKWYHIATGEKTLFLRGTQKLGPPSCLPALDALFRVGY